LLGAAQHDANGVAGTRRGAMLKRNIQVPVNCLREAAGIA